MRNFVAKNDFNRASTHKSARDYTRLSKHELLEEIMEENWDVNESGIDLFEEEELPLKDPKQWESIKETAL
ncbi:hypothetical protein BNKMLPFJ_00163 [Escherichia phage vB_EcoS-26175IV]|uniref:Metallopeptidase n=1 Tax=Escherichia phage vB_EcoS-26175I TaxID=2576478 RepID=A0A5P1M7D1_9CAUD|nr:hypothetical protein HEDJPLGI_00142 [Escherichia phage vB_EcoS-26175I]QDK00169.1 hypothetical protein EGCEDKNN_00089 [Escherichia phage vB_EcoS-26175II]QDK00310.1 hypothetical protein INCEGHDL_00103 [Escherichia phage vB_EcoS-26175III]QDK00528.1 hypothetical protein BNKMLPFJ_00163 [Escherichia phage vB_EcoS-26175IV]QDK00607.1 hypothetical protein JOHFDMOO_00084 [Escherichia phage vB_EcoS-26175V]